MSITWWLNTAQLYLVTIGALLIVLYLWNTRQFMDKWLSPEGKEAYAQHSRLLMIGVGLLVAWLLIQYLAILFL
jgi:uncharacterized membrane protein YidH (DUF202 family)